MNPPGSRVISALLISTALASPRIDCVSEPRVLWGYGMALSPELRVSGVDAGPSVALGGGGSATVALGARGWRLGPYGDAGIAADPSLRAAGGLELVRGHAPEHFARGDYDSEGGAWYARLGYGRIWGFPGLTGEREWVGSIGWTTRNDVQTHSIAGFEGYCERPRWDRRRAVYRGVGRAYFAAGGGLRLDVARGPEHWRVGLALTWSPGFEDDVAGQLRAGLAAAEGARVVGSRRDVHAPRGEFGPIAIDDRCGGRSEPWLALRITSRGPEPELRELRPALDAIAHAHGAGHSTLTEGCSAKRALAWSLTDWTAVDALAAELAAELRRQGVGAELLIRILGEA